MLFVLNKFAGQILNDKLAQGIVAECIRYGIYRPTKQSASIKEKWNTSQKGTVSRELLTKDEVDFIIKHNPQSIRRQGLQEAILLALQPSSTSAKNWD